MPRIAREKSVSGIYHIMLRGANRQEIFHDDNDCIRFLNTVARYKKESEMNLFGWCLMDNHVHLLLKEGKEDLAITMKRISVSYAVYYNSKYNTTGHLFQDRYKSERVDSDRSLIAVLRYIHQNPIKAGIILKPADWKWSSCSGYYGKEYYPSSLLDKEMVLSLFSDDRKIAIVKFIEYNEMGNEDEYLENNQRIRLTDEEAREEIIKKVKECNVATVKSLPKLQRDEIVKKVKNIDGVTQRQISRIFGISLSLVNRA